MGSVSIKNLTRRKGMPRFAYAAVAETILPGWDISLVFVGSTRARSLNEGLRGKRYAPNVLSYALSERSGEIIICRVEAEKQASAYAMGKREFILYLFIHGLLHIKGWVHSAKMETRERKLVAQFATGSTRALTHVTTNRNRNRHRHVPSKDGRRRRTR